MGKRKRNKNQARNLAAKKRPRRPDDYLRHGPLEMARFGKFVVWRNNMSEEQFDVMQGKLVEHFPEVCHEIDNKISRIVDMVKTLPSDELLKRAYWEVAARNLNVESEIDIDHDGAVSLRMLDYIQSIIVSVQPAEAIQDDVTEEQWRKLRTLVGDLFSQLNTEFPICQTAVNRKDAGFNIDFEEFRFKAQMYWCNVRGQRYLCHDIPFFRDVLSPHDEVLKELYGISKKEFLEALQEIQDSLTLGIGKVVEDLRKFQNDVMAKLDEKIERKDFAELNDPLDMTKKVIEESGWEAWQNDIAGRFFGLDLFDLEKVAKLPRLLLDELSWEPGQDAEFFKEGEYKGWPLRIWPVFKRPFIKLKGHYYCFDLYSLFDNLYRSVQRVIIRKKPGYDPIWNDKQKELSEQVPIELFEKLLPGVQVYQSVYYHWHTRPGGIKDWCEADALLIYEDHLIIMEVKAGAFTYTSPAADFSSYIKSLHNLVFKPAEQGKRFLGYLESDDEVRLYDKDHKEIGKISRKDFKHITICAVTLDPFTELAAQVQHLKKIGIDVGTRPVWSISIDDLRVYSDIFDNPLVFLHFIEERMRAFQSDLIQTEDELDHLGLYLKHNIYTQYVRELNPKGPIMWHGYRSDIDRYFSEKLHDSKAVCHLKQDMPARLKEIIDLLASSRKLGCRKVASMLLDSDGRCRDQITSGINEALDHQSRLGKAKSLSTHGNVKITLFCWQHGRLERDRKNALEHAQAVMLITQDNERLLLELTFDTFGTLVDIDFAFLSLGGTSDVALQRLKAIAEALRVKRIDKAKQTHREIGRNELCPCGSGKKYKKCCFLRP